MNKEQFQQLRDAVANDLFVEKGVGFNMTSVITEANGVKDLTGHNCKTVCCLAGYTLLANGYTLGGRGGGYLFMTPEYAHPVPSADRTAAELLDIDIWERRTLFQPPYYADPNYSNDKYSKERALRVLDKCIEEGRVPLDVWTLA